jgi:hypothetical protein
VLANSLKSECFALQDALLKTKSKAYAELSNNLSKELKEIMP